MYVKSTRILNEHPHLPKPSSPITDLFICLTRVNKGEIRGSQINKNYARTKCRGIPIMLITHRILSVYTIMRDHQPYFQIFWPTGTSIQVLSVSRSTILFTSQINRDQDYFLPPPPPPPPVEQRP